MLRSVEKASFSTRTQFDQGLHRGHWYKFDPKVDRYRREEMMEIESTLRRSDNHIFLRQIPNCMALKGGKHVTLRRSLDIAVKWGFPLESNGEAIGWRDTTTITSYISNEDDPDAPLEKEILNFKGEVYPKYGNPWEILMGIHNFEGITAKVWPESSVNLRDKIPKALLWPGFKGSGTTFTRIADPKDLMWVLMNRTHWGTFIRDKRKTAKDPFLNRLVERLNAFFNCKSDPNWTGKFKRSLYPKGYTSATFGTRKHRFLELITSVNGMFWQRFISIKDEQWDWLKFDMFVIEMISLLLSDEFIEPSDESINIDTLYMRIKSVRSDIKLNLEKGRPSDKGNLPRSLNYLQHNVVYGKEGIERLSRLTILMQNRGMGTPPLICKLQATVKTLTVLQQESTPLTPTEKGILRGLLERFTKELPKDVFTGLSTKAGVNISNSACWEKTRTEGGTICEINEILNGGKHRVKVRDLYTGKVIDYKHLSECTIGEYVFWSSLDVVLCTETEELSSVFVATLNDPGKSRTITKGMAALKIILDAVHGICAYPLGKVQSSRSGMRDENHTWNIFQDFFKKDAEEILFKELSQKIDIVDGYGTVEITYRNAFILPSDEEQATDYMEHEVGGLLGNYWMNLVGIPPILRGIVNRVCYHPRKVFFKATGPLENIGERVDDSTRFIWSRRGILMGDPMTKVVLHLHNAVTTMVSKLDASDLLTSFNNPGTILECLKRTGPPSRLTRPSKGE